MKSGSLGTSWNRSSQSRLRPGRTLPAVCWPWLLELLLRLPCSWAERAWRQQAEPVMTMAPELGAKGPISQSWAASHDPAANLWRLPEPQILSLLQARAPAPARATWSPGSEAGQAHRAEGTDPRTHSMSGPLGGCMGTSTFSDLLHQAPSCPPQQKYQLFIYVHRLACSRHPIRHAQIHREIKTDAREGVPSRSRLRAVFTHMQVAQNSPPNPRTKDTFR